MAKLVLWRGDLGGAEVSQVRLHGDRLTATGTQMGVEPLPAITAVPELRAHTLIAMPGPALAICTVYLATHPDRSLGTAAQRVLDRLRHLWAAVA